MIIGKIHLNFKNKVDFLEENLDYIITFGKVQPFDKNGLISKVFGNERDLSGTELIKCPAINTSMFVLEIQ